MEREKPPKAGRSLQPTEVAAILKHLERWCWSIVSAFVLTGARRSELLGFDFPGATEGERATKDPLTWGEVDLEARQIVIPPHRCKHGETRVIEVNADLLSILKGLPSRLRGASDPSAPVFLDGTGEPARPDHVLKCFQKAAAKAGIKNAHALVGSHHVGTAEGRVSQEHSPL